MTTLTIKNLPDILYGRIKELAHLHKRSINSEVITTLEQVLLAKQINMSNILAEARHLRTLTKSHKITEAQLNAAKNQGRS